MPEIGARPLHRVKGRPVLVRRLRGLLVAAHRFARARATSADDRLWAARCIDVLTDAVARVDPGSVSVTGPDTPRGPL